MSEFVTPSGRVSWINTKHSREKPKGGQGAKENPAPRKAKKNAKNPKGTHTVKTLYIDKYGKKHWIV
jgi:hypothetical protein